MKERYEELLAREVELQEECASLVEALDEVMFCDDDIPVSERENYYREAAEVYAGLVATLQVERRHLQRQLALWQRMHKAIEESNQS